MFDEICRRDVTAAYAPSTSATLPSPPSFGPEIPLLLHRGPCAVEPSKPCATCRDRGTGPRRSALHLIYKHRNRGQIGAQRGLVSGKQCPAGDAEILAHMPCTESAGGQGAAGARKRLGRHRKGKPEGPRVSDQWILRRRSPFPNPSCGDLSEAQALCRVLTGGSGLPPGYSRRI